MATLLLAALLLQGGADSIEELVHDLNDDRIEARERAHARLIAAGDKSIPALRRALNSSSAEVRVRAGLILETIERQVREFAHDEREKRTLLLASRTGAERAPGSAAAEGVRFDLRATAFGDGWIVATKPVNYLARRPDEGPGKGRLHFEIVEIVDDAGRVLAVERCGRCSPGKVFV